MTESQIQKVMALVSRVVINCADLAEEKIDVSDLQASIAAVEAALRECEDSPVSQGEPVAWRLKDPDPHGRWEWVLYQPADFKNGVNPRDAIPGLESLYTHPQQASGPMTDEQIYELAEPYGAFEYGDAQGDKRLAFARAVECTHNIKGKK